MQIINRYLYSAMKKIVLTHHNASLCIGDLIASELSGDTVASQQIIK